MDNTSSNFILFLSKTKEIYLSNSTNFTEEPPFSTISKIELGNEFIPDKYNENNNRNGK